MSKRKRIIALLVGVILLAGTAGTLAWLSVTGVLVNQFGIGSVTPSVQETLNGKVKSDVKAKNTGTAPAYIRAAVDIYWQDQDGTRLWDEPKEEPKGEADYEIAWSVADASGANSAYNWVKASDGFYYWTSPVAPGAEPACSLIGLPSSRQPKVAILSWISPLKRSRRCPMRPCTTHGVARSRMTCWCRRMEVRKYGVPDS